MEGDSFQAVKQIPDYNLAWQHFSSEILFLSMHVYKKEGHHSPELIWMHLPPLQSRERRTVTGEEELQIQSRDSGIGTSVHQNDIAKQMLYYQTTFRSLGLHQHKQNVSLFTFGPSFCLTRWCASQWWSKVYVLKSILVFNNYLNR